MSPLHKFHEMGRACISAHVITVTTRLNSTKFGIRKRGSTSESMGKFLFSYIRVKITLRPPLYDVQIELISLV